MMTPFESWVLGLLAFLAGGVAVRASMWLASIARSQDDEDDDDADEEDCDDDEDDDDSDDESDEDKRIAQLP